MFLAHKGFLRCVGETSHDGGHVVAAAEADHALGTPFRRASTKMAMAPRLFEAVMHPPAPLDEATDVFEPDEKDAVAGITATLRYQIQMSLTMIQAHRSPLVMLAAAPAPAAAESHVREVADVEKTKLSKSAAYRIVYGQSPPT